jgi:DNA-binding PadR family transcriptional regulator
MAANQETRGEVTDTGLHGDKIVADLTAFQHNVLIVLTGLTEPHGLRIKHELEDYYDSDVNHGRLYPNLDDLVSDGLIRKGEIDKRTNSYDITEKGRRALLTRRDWEETYFNSDN